MGVVDKLTQDNITVEVAYALAEKQRIITLSVAPNTTALQAIIASGIVAEFAEIDLAQTKMGIFGKQIKPDTLLQAQDRIELYRPLIADAKLLRKQRAKDGAKSSIKQQR